MHTDRACQPAMQRPLTNRPALARVASQQLMPRGGGADAPKGPGRLQCAKLVRAQVGTLLLRRDGLLKLLALLPLLGNYQGRRHAGRLLCGPAAGGSCRRSGFRSWLSPLSGSRDCPPATRAVRAHPGPTLAIGRGKAMAQFLIVILCIAICGHTPVMGSRHTRNPLYCNLS
jgi:hypothetical protein